MQAQAGFNSKLLVLKEYRCANCNKLLFKAYLAGNGTCLEVKCRRCGHMDIFYGGAGSEAPSPSLLVKGGMAALSWVIFLFSF